MVHLIYTDTDDYEAAYASLNLLKEQALLDLAITEGSDSQDQSGGFDWKSETNATDFSWSESDGRSRHNSSSGSSVTTTNESSAGNWDDVGDKDGNLAELKFMLPDLPNLTIELAYKKYKGDYNKVVDHLLNAQYLLAENEIPSGVDGFFEAAEQQYGKKGKKKRGKKSQQISLQEQYRFLDGTEESNLSKPFSAALKSPSRPTDPGRILDSRNYAKVTAGISTNTPRAPWAVTAQVPHAYSTPSTPAEPSEEWTQIKGRRRSTSGTSSAYLPPTRKPDTRNTTSKDAMAMAQAYSHETSTYYEKAHLAFRRSNKDNLMGAVASYYADCGREALEASKKYNELAQYRIVDENSRDKGSAASRAGYAEDCVDLHGVTVPVGKKIVKEKLALWWGGGRLESEVAKQPFKIVSTLLVVVKMLKSRIGSS